MNDFPALMFFKGALLKDPDGVLERQGPRSRAGFRMRFTSVPDARAHTNDTFFSIVSAYATIIPMSATFGPAIDREFP